MNLDRAYAIALRALVDPRKTAAFGKDLPEELAEQLRLYLEAELKIRALSCQFLFVRDEPFLLMAGVDEASLPALCSLVDVQRTTLFRYERGDASTVTLTPLQVKVGD